MNKYQSGRSQLALSAPSRSAGSATERYELAGASHLAWLVEVASLCGDVIFFFFQAEDGIRDHCVTGVRRVLFRSRVLEESLSATPIERIHGIVNGTTNFILTEMTAGSTYAEALAEPQRVGYAEADPSYDVSGRYAAAKMAILARGLR